ncbi:unnamed protein product [Peronospora destructor]|uniref:Uncharacterized protein n=1 Tax=Peronospora destructor TaxID=86335 RepID=A0AAV0V461_9STRA|nr:unnamed protein product [Peronospora destructor]
MVALNKTGVIAFMLETNAPSVMIINTTDAPIVDLAAETLATFGVNMIDSLLELSTALGDESSPSASRGPSDLKMTDPIVRNFLSEEDIVIMDQELEAQLRAAARESILSAALVKCNADTPFQEAWALIEHRFKLLEGFAGGFASVFSCTPIAAHGSTSDLALCHSEMNTDQVLLANFSLEGTLHAQQFPALTALNENFDSKASRKNTAAASLTTEL